MNIGATAVTDTGVYFQWGDTQGYTAAQVGTDKNFTWDDYIYYDSENYEFTKYNSNDGLTTLQATDDAVQYAWNGNWRMPTFSEFQTLGEAVNTAWTQVNGVSGMMCTDKTDETKTLFFPACGYADDGGLYNVGISGMYWCSILYYDGDNEAYSLEFDEGGPAFGASYNRSHGFVIRGVLDE